MQPRGYVPNNFFNGTTPRLSCLALRNCDINRKSPLFKGFRQLEIRNPSTVLRPILSVWLDVLDEMPQLETLILQSATPVVLRGASLPSDVERTVTLPSLVYLDIGASDGRDVRENLPYVSRHMPTDLRMPNPTEHPDLDVELPSHIDLFTATRSARVTFIVTNEEDGSPEFDAGVFDTAMVALPLNTLVTPTARNVTRFFDKQVWFRHA
ncbi:hypothetical protein BJY52DRAFT_1189533 [Lactarius psammicola]|nr:hypothetical protein BJY52DRAFT_1189533 [Lactarius psammicola]